MTCYMRATFHCHMWGLRKFLILDHFGFRSFELGILNLYSLFFPLLPKRWERKTRDESVLLLPVTSAALCVSYSSFPGIMILTAWRIKPERQRAPGCAWKKITLFCIGSRELCPPTVYFLLPFSFFFFLPQKDTNAEIIPERSRINTTRKQSLWKASHSPAVCKCEKLSNWAAGWV